MLTHGLLSAPIYYGIGKNKALNVAGKLKLLLPGQVEATEHQHLSESRKFVAVCHGAKNER